MSENDSYAFFGRIHPERTSVTMDEAMEMQHENEFGGFEMEVFIHSSHVLVDATVPEDIDDLTTFRNVVQSSVASLTDPQSFLQGSHVEIEIFAVITPTGYKRVFGIEYDYISGKLGYDESEHLMEEIIDIYRSETGPYLQRCFRDYRLAMKHPEDTGFYCFRAIESLRQFFENREGNKKKSWEKLREATDTNRQTIEDNIEAYSKARRHGGVFSITSDERRIVLETTWDIIRSFIEYAGTKSN